MEMQRERALRELPIWRLLQRHKSLVLNSMFGLSLPLNVLITHLHSIDPETTPLWLVRLEHVLTYLLGTAQLTSCIAAFTLHALQWGPLRLRLRWKAQSGLRYREV